MAKPTQRYILQWAKMISPQVKYFGFTLEDNAPISFVPGQFITLHIHSPEKNKILHRSYSIANAPGQNNLIELACSYVEGGVASNLLFNLKPGNSIEASGPFGLFVLKEEKPARYILLATGTGIAPYRSMISELRTRLKQNPNFNVVVAQGVRSPKELLFGDDFCSLDAEFPNCTFKALYSREGKDSLAHYEQMGHVQDIFPNLNLNPSQDIVYLCGNPNMIDDAFNELTNLGFDRKNIRREKYLFSH